MEVVIVPSTRQKIWDTVPNAGPTPARDAYMGAPFLRWRAYAEASGWPWYILSTKFGLLSPQQTITNYHVTISEAESDPAFLATLRAQFREHQIDRCQRVLVLDWERFEALTRRALDPAPTKVELHKILY